MLRSLRLCQAIANNDVGKVQRILMNSKTLDVNQTILNGRTTPLRVAIKAESCEITRILLSRGADANANDRKVGNALHYAVRTGRTELVRLILYSGNKRSGKGVEIDAQNERKMTPLLLAISLEHYDIVKLLLENNASMRVYDGSNNSPLGAAVKSANFRLAVILLNYGANVDCRNHLGKTAFHMSLCCNKDDTITELLLLHRPSLTTKDALGRSALHYAAMCQDSYMVSKLVSKQAMGALVNEVTSDMETPLHLLLRLNVSISEEEVIKVARVLLDHGARIDAVDASQATALIYAVQSERLQVARLLLQRGANPNVHGSMSPLYLALVKTDGELARLMIEKGADVGFRNEEGKSLLCVASRTFRKDTRPGVMRLLFERGATISQCDGRGMDEVFFQRLLNYEFEFLNRV